MIEDALTIFQASVTAQTSEHTSLAVSTKFSFRPWVVSDSCESVPPGMHLEVFKKLTRF